MIRRHTGDATYCKSRNIAGVQAREGRTWPAVAAAVFAGEILVDTFYGNELWQAVGFGVADVVEPLIGASVVLGL